MSTPPDPDPDSGESETDEPITDDESITDDEPTTTDTDFGGSDADPRDSETDLADSETEAADPETAIYDLPAEATVDDLEDGGRYHATVNGVVPYGVFVDLSESVSGLVHESELDGEYAAGDDIAVELIEMRENGDLGFTEIESGQAETVAVEHEKSVATADDLDGVVGENVRLEGEVVQINQTGGPTIFTLRDTTGTIPCAAFEAAGVRAYPEIDRGDLVGIEGTVEEREGALQVEAESLQEIAGADAEDLRERLDAAIEERAAAREVEPLIEWPALDALREDLEAVATRLRRAILENRPIKLRHHADGDGMCAAIPVERALARFAGEVHEDPDAPRHLLTRLPSKAPYYEMEDAVRDLDHSLGDRDRHGQALPVFVMLDNGSTEEDVPAYESLAQYDIPVLAVDHHHPDPEAVAPYLEEHVNPYLHGEDYRITTGMLCVELARMIDPEITEDVEHVPAVAGVADHSEADAMADYAELATEAGYDEDTIEDIADALDYAAHWLRYSAGTELLTDVLGVDREDVEDVADEDRHRELVDFLADSAESDVREQLDAALPHVEEGSLDNGADLYRLDVEKYAHRFTYPAPGKTTGAIHDRKVAAGDGPVITVGYGPDFAVLRSDGVRLDIPTMVDELTDEIDGGGVSGGGHLVVGSIKFVKGMREEVLDALEAKMGAAELDEDLSSAASGGLD